MLFSKVSVEIIKWKRYLFEFWHISAKNYGVKNVEKHVDRLGPYGRGTSCGY
jgi:hypothetical protein